MRKYWLSLACLMMVLGWTSPCMAVSPIKWQLEWMEAGELREEVRIPVNITETPVDKAWNRIQDDDEWVYQRTVQGWSNYQSHPDGLPLIIRENKNILYSLTEIQTDPHPPINWFQEIAGPNELQLIIEVPGLILTSTADQRNDLFSSWTLSRGTDLSRGGVILKVIRIDGLVMGIGIVTIGLILAVFTFYRRVRKAEQIIAETYAIPPRDHRPEREDPK